MIRLYLPVSVSAWYLYLHGTYILTLSAFRLQMDTIHAVQEHGGRRSEVPWHECVSPTMLDGVKAVYMCGGKGKGRI